MSCNEEQSGLQLNKRLKTHCKLLLALQWDQLIGHTYVRALLGQGGWLPYHSLMLLPLHPTPPTFHAVSSTAHSKVQAQ